MTRPPSLHAAAEVCEQRQQPHAVLWCSSQTSWRLPFASCCDNDQPVLTFLLFAFPHDGAGWSWLTFLQESSIIK